MGDDGRGIDWSRLRERAERLGIDTSGLEDAELLFLQGRSSRSDISDISGRGVGMGAARGQLTVTTTPGTGTRFLCRLPGEAAMTDATTPPDVESAVQLASPSARARANASA